MAIRKHLAVVAVAALSLVGLSGCSNLVGKEDPTVKIQAWFDAVQSNDADAALEILPADAALGDTTLLTSDVLALSTGIFDVEIEPFATGQIALDATYRVGSYTSTITFDIEETEEGYNITSDNAYTKLDLNLSPIIRSYEVNGKFVEAREPRSYVVFPGDYHILPRDSELIQGGDFTFNTAEDARSGEVPVTPSDYLKTEATNYLNAALKACVEHVDPLTRDASCPNFYRVEKKREPKDAKWTLLFDPSYTISYVDGRFEITAIENASILTVKYLTAPDSESGTETENANPQPREMEAGVGLNWIVFVTANEDGSLNYEFQVTDPGCTSETHVCI